MLNTEVTEDIPLSSKISDISDIDVPPLDLLNTEVTEDIPLSINTSTSNTETDNNSKGSTDETSDLRKMSHKNYEKQFPQFYYSATEDGWYCKICSSFSDVRITDQAFVNKAGTFYF